MIPLPFVDKNDLEHALEYLYKGEVTVQCEKARQVIDALSNLGADVTGATKIQDIVESSDDDQYDDDSRQQPNSAGKLKDGEAEEDDGVSEAHEDEPGELSKGGYDVGNVAADPLEEKLRCVICDIIFTQVGSRNRHMRLKHWN